MAENDVTIQINVEAKDAQAAIELFGKESVKVLKKTEKESDSLFSSLKESGKGIKNFFGTFQSAFLPITATIAGVVSSFRILGEAINQAAQDAKLTRQIESSLLATDEASKQAVDSVLEFADAIKDTTGLSDDLAKTAFITAKSFGITSAEAQKLTKAAIDLAAATGVDVDTAVRQLGGTLDGSIGKVGNLGAEFRNLTTEQLKSGAAIDLVTQKFGGTASRELDTYQGSLNQLKNATDDFLKVFGKIVIESDLVKNALSGVAGAINATTEALSSKQDTTANLERSLSIVAALGGNVQAAADSVLKAQERIALAGIEVGKTSQQITSGFAAIVEAQVGATKSSADFEDRLKSLIPNELPKKLELTGKALEDFNKSQKEAEQSFVNFKNKLLQQSGDDETRIRAKYNAEREELKKLVNEKKLTEEKESKLRIILNKNEAKEIDDYRKKLDKERRDKEQEALDALRLKIQKIAAEPITIFFQKEDPNLQEIGSAIAGGFSAALSGKSGAVKTIAALGGAIAEKFIPGIGPVVSEILTKLSAGPEQAKAFVKEFVNAIPDILIAIVDALPEAISGIVETVFSADFILRLGTAVGKAFLFVVTAGLSKWGPIWAAKIGDYLGARLTEPIQKAFSPLIKALENISGAFKELPQQFINFIESIGPAFINAFSQFIPTFIDALNNFIANISNAIFRPLEKLFNPLNQGLKNVSDGLQRLLDPIERLIAALKGGKGGGQGLIKEFFGGVYQRAGGGKGGGEGVFKETLKRIGFANGGIVPAYAADGMFVPRGTDTVPAMLTPGEMVVPRDMVGELGAFLSAQGPQSNGSDQAILAAILAAVQAPMTVTAEAKVNQSAFADIILQLNRQNARLSA
jgi:hypothetical protein